MTEQLHITQCDDPAYLPFAKSRIKAMRATGQKFLSQKFDVGGVRVDVRIEGEHSFVSIGGGVTILSGVVRNGGIIETVNPGPPPETIRELAMFRPTADCHRKVLHRSGAREFARVEQLATLPDAGLSPEVAVDAQTAAFGPSMYSGLMQEWVQMTLGLPEFRDEVKLIYGYMWACTHIISVSDKGNYFLVEISRENGIRAMRLPGKPGGRAHHASMRSAIRFGMAPTGKGFPVGGELQEAIANGSVINIMPAAELDPFYAGDKYPLSEDHGWTTNRLGTEAHNMTFHTGGDGEVTAKHYKITLSLVEPPIVEPGGPRVIGDYSIVLVSEGVLYGSRYESFVCSYEHASAGFRQFLTRSPDTSDQVGTRASNATLFVYFDGDTLHRVIRIYTDMWIEESRVSGTYGAHNSGSFAKEYYVDSENPGAPPSYTDATWGVQVSRYVGSSFFSANQTPVAIFPRGMRNGWISYRYTTGGHMTYDGSADPEAGPLATGVLYTFWIDGLKSVYPEGVTRTYPLLNGEILFYNEMLTEDYSRVSIYVAGFSTETIIADAKTSELTWYPGGAVTTVTGNPGYEFINYLRSGSVSAPGLRPPQIMWHEDCYGENSAKTATLDTVVCAGEVFAGVTETEGASYSFTGYTRSTKPTRADLESEGPPP